MFPYFFEPLFAPRYLAQPILAQRLMSLTQGYFPITDLAVYVSDQQVSVVVPVPGVVPEHIKVTMHGTSNGQTQAQGQVVRLGYEVGGVAHEHQVELPGLVDSNSAHAQVKDGVLVISLARVTTPEPVSVQVHVN